MAFTLLDIEAIDKAIASGNKEIRINGRVRVYQSTTEMLKARKTMIDDYQKSISKPRRRSFRTTTQKPL